LFKEDQHMSLIQWIGVAIFLFGGFVESSYEIQRLIFKKDPKNAGKPYLGGIVVYLCFIVCICFVFLLL